jgi:xanthine dehydrogenase accessory factor
MTRGHQSDYQVVSQILKSKAGYIGVIGSRSKTVALKARLLKDGFTEADFERLSIPIGIEICSETPAEIAVSITAQLIKVRAIKAGSRKANYLEEKRNKDE